MQVARTVKDKGFSLSDGPSRGREAATVSSSKRKREGRGSSNCRRLCWAPESPGRSFATSDRERHLPLLAADSRERRTPGPMPEARGVTTTSLRTAPGDGYCTCLTTHLPMTLEAEPADGGGVCPQNQTAGPSGIAADLKTHPVDVRPELQLVWGNLRDRWFP